MTAGGNHESELSEEQPGIEPVLVTGTHRSGTTWVGQMLSLSDELAPVHEPFNPANRWTWLSKPPKTWFTYDDVVSATGASRQEIDSDLDRLRELRYPLATQLGRVTDPRGLAAVARDYSRCLYWRRQGRSLLMKDPIAFFLAPWLNVEFDLRPVVLTRHPAAFVSSLKRLDWTFDANEWLRQPLLMAGPLASHVGRIEALRRADDIIDLASHLWTIMNGIVLHDYQRREGWIVCRYEDLAADPPGAFAELYSSLGLSFSSTAVSRMTKWTEGGSTGAEGSHMSVDRRSSTAMWTWLDRLTTDEIERVRRLTSDVADHFYDVADWVGPPQTS